jgi:chromosome segregation ATPase
VDWQTIGTAVGSAGTVLTVLLRLGGQLRDRMQKAADDRAEQHAENLARFDKLNHSLEYLNKCYDDIRSEQQNTRDSLTSIKFQIENLDKRVDALERRK